MNNEIIYVELKSGFSDDGPAWIGPAGYSKSGATVYFNGKAFKSLKGSGVGANCFDIESGDEYWISGVKKNGLDRHWAGRGKILIDEKCIDTYLKEVGLSVLPKNLEVTELSPSVASPLHHNLENHKFETEREY
jgi:hypothetical protein